MNNIHKKMGHFNLPERLSNSRPKDSGWYTGKREGIAGFIGYNEKFSGWH